MMNIKRLPGVVYTHKLKTSTFLFVVFLVLYLMLHWGFVCTNYSTLREIDKLCTRYKSRKAVGSLCAPLCTDKTVHSVSCTAAHAGKELVFTAQWGSNTLVFKSSTSKEDLYAEPVVIRETRKLLWKERNIQETVRLENYPKHFPIKTHDKAKTKKSKRSAGFNQLTENDFERFIRDTITNRLNISISNEQLQSLKYLQVKNKYIFDENSLERKIEKLDILQLLNSQEYLLSTLFSDRNVFPQIVGTCGNFFAVEYLKIPQMSSVFASDDKEEWSERMKLAIMVMDLLEELETNFPDALHLCDVKMDHFGFADNAQRLKFLDLDTVYTNNVLEKMLSTGRSCTKHEDCDLFDCKSLCNSATNVCDGGIVNNNLQIVCEKIFIGWTMSGKMIVPGLLMSEHTPASLAALLRLCAENRRSQVPEDIRQRLYTTLTEMDQLLSS